MNHSTRGPGAPSGRRIAGRAQLDPATDPYHPRRKPPEPMVCRQCGVFYQHGRWQWGVAPQGASEDLCPACHRANDDFPAGIVTLHGHFAPARRDEITNLARHHEAAEKQEHPLNRIIRIEETSDALTITTTDLHLPPRIGEAVSKAFHGKLDMSFDEDGYFARVDWHPPEPGKS